MAEQPDQPPAVPEDAEETPGYKPPAPKSVTDILQQDTEDESLRKYKETLLGSASAEKVVVFPEDPRHVIVQKLALLVEGRDDVELDLSGKGNDGIVLHLVYMQTKPKRIRLCLGPKPLLRLLLTFRAAQ